MFQYGVVYSVSQKNPPPEGSWLIHFFHKRLRNLINFYTPIIRSYLRYIMNFYSIILDVNEVTPY